MKDILLVDDERPFLLSLKDGLTAYSSEFNVILATSVPEAQTILSVMDIDLLVTDLKLPGTDGFQLLASVSRSYPRLPVIVMTAFGTPEIEARLSRMSALHYLEKPLDFDELTRTIESALSSESLSFIRGITLATFLQLVHMEKKTCTLKIRTGQRLGYLFLRQGELLDAQTGDLTGEAAALQILAWDDTDIEMDAMCRRTVKVIASSLEFLLMEACRIKDESGTSDSFTHPEPEQMPSREVVEQLHELLSSSPDITEFALFDGAGFLDDQQGASGHLAQLEPGVLNDLCQELEQHLNGGSVRYLQFTTRGKQRHLLLHQHPHFIAMTLARGGRVDRIIDTLANSRHANNLMAKGAI